MVRFSIRLSSPTVSNAPYQCTIHDHYFFIGLGQIYTHIHANIHSCSTVNGCLHYYKTEEIITIITGNPFLKKKLQQCTRISYNEQDAKGTYGFMFKFAFIRFIARNDTHSRKNRIIINKVHPARPVLLHSTKLLSLLRSTYIVFIKMSTD